MSFDRSIATVETFADVQIQEPFVCERLPGWHVARPDTSCDLACLALGLACREDELAAHNAEVDSSAEVLALIRRLEASTTATTCSDEWGATSGVPLFWPDGCVHSMSGRDFETFDCSRAPTPAGQEKQRLCYCVDSQTGPQHARGLPQGGRWWADR